MYTSLTNIIEASEDNRKIEVQNDIKFHSCIFLSTNLKFQKFLPKILFR